jgi:uncharacterized coiled-coil protein SlyX
MGRVTVAAMNEDRIIALETMLAHHTQVVDELNEVVTAQAEAITRLERRIERLRDRLREAGGDAGGGHTFGERPPHY